VELRDGKVLAAFALLCRDTNSEQSYDARALCIEPSYLGTGVAEALLERLEVEALGSGSSAIVRIETSSRKERATGVGILASCGFALIGHIPDFYSPGDDFFMYAKHLKRASESEKGREGEA